MPLSCYRTALQLCLRPHLLKTGREPWSLCRLGFSARSGGWLQSNPSGVACRRRFAALPLARILKGLVGPSCHMLMEHMGK